MERFGSSTFCRSLSLKEIPKCPSGHQILYRRSSRLCQANHQLTISTVTPGMGVQLAIYPAPLGSTHHPVSTSKYPGFNRSLILSMGSAFEGSMGLSMAATRSGVGGAGSL